MPKSGKRLKKVRSHPYDKDSEETAPPRFNGAFDFSADAPYNNFVSALYTLSFLSYITLLM